MSHFIYNSYCVVHAGAVRVAQVPEGVQAQLAQQQAAESAEIAEATVSVTLLTMAAIAMLAALAIGAGEDADPLASMALWVSAGLSLLWSLRPVRHAAERMDSAFGHWKLARERAAADEATWNVALQDARLMADLARAMDRQER